MANKATNRIKIILVEQNKTSKWLAEKLGKNESTISRWCTNNTQPPIDTLTDIAKLLNVDIRELLSSTKTKSN
ncbi:MAG TPA: helix-turn-helix transcriptional regulator [Saprospiraceae bacterium]|nr:helix-turn-helix transcriptional regulator [Saprospiraceae bacterium]